MKQWQSTVPEFFPSRFFISYSSLNAATAANLQQELSAVGHEVWRDRTSLTIGDNWKAEVDSAIRTSDEIVVLLTPESASSEAVAFEIEQAVRHTKRVNIFATFDPRTLPDLNRRISEINYVTIAPDDVTASNLMRHLLGNGEHSHPVGMREFEWLASRKIFPKFNECISEGSIDRALANRYFSYRSIFERHPNKANGSVWLNLALCGAMAGEKEPALSCIETAASLLPHPVVGYFHVCFLLWRTRPRHVSPVLLDRCIDIAQRSLDARRSPLAAVLLSALLADGQRASGPMLAQLCNEALEAVRTVERDKSEILRLLWFLPMTEETGMPIPVGLVLKKLREALGA